MINRNTLVFNLYNLILFLLKKHKYVTMFNYFNIYSFLES